MGTEEMKNVDSNESSSKYAPGKDDKSANSPHEKALALISDEKTINTPTTLQPPTVEKIPDPALEKKSGDSLDRDAALAQVVTEKKLALVKAWEENEKIKTDNKAYKKLSAVGAWENSKKAVVDAQLKKIEEKYERKKAEYAEKMNNKKAEIHKEAEEKKAIVDAQRSESFLKIEETAAKFRATGNIPKRVIGCFGF